MSEGQSLISFGSVDWLLDPEIHPTHFCVDMHARLDVPITVSLGGRTIEQTLYFALQPTVDPRVRLSGSSLELDIARCPWYFGFTPPPKDLRADAAHDDAENKKRREFLCEVMKGAGDELRAFLADLRAMPGRIFAALRAEIPKFLDHVVGFLRHIGSAEEYIRHTLEAISHAIEQKVRKAIEWTVDLARDVAHWLLTTTDQLGGLAADVCRLVVESALVLYEGVLEGAGRLSTLLQESFAMMAKDPSRFVAQIRAAVGGLVQSTILRTKAFAAEIEGHLAAGLAALVKAEGFAEAKIILFMEAVAQGISDGADKVKRTARDVADFFSRLVETATGALHEVSNDPSVLYGWIGKLIRIGVKAYYETTKQQIEWMIMGANAIGRAARALAAHIQDFAQKTAAELEPYVKAVIKEWSDLAKVVGKASREAFARFLQTLAGWKRSLFHAACRVLQGAEDLLTALIGPEHLAEIKEALKFICSFLDDVALKVGQVIDCLYQIGRALAVDLPRDLAKFGEATQAWLGQQAHALGTGLKKAFRFFVLEIGGVVRSSPLVQALIAIFNGMLTVAKAIGVFIAEKGKQLGDWLKPKIKHALSKLEEMARALEAFMEGTGEGSVLEARFRRLSVAQPRGSKRSQAKVKLLPTLPSDHKLPGDDVLLPALQALAGEAGIELGALELFTFDDWRFSAPHPVNGLVDVGQREPSKTRFLPIPMTPDKDMVFRVCMKPRMWAIDPRYSWGYGSSNQLRLADIDGDGKVEEWEAYKEAQKRRDAAKDGDPFTAADMQMLLDQAKNVLHGVPYREIGAPFGLLATYDGGAWNWFAVASIGDEDVGMQVQNDGADPKAPVGSLLRVSAGGTLLPSGQKVDRTGLGLFWQGKHLFGASNYPVLYHVEQRIFWDEFASGFGNAGMSTFVVLRGGQAGNDFQLRGELYQDFSLLPLGGGLRLPTGMYRPTIRASLAMSGSGGAALAGSGGFRLGLQYASKEPLAVVLGDEVKEEEKGKGVVDKVLAKLKEEFKIEDILPTLQKLLSPVLRLLMFDREYEAKLACAGAIAIGDELAIVKKREWAQETAGRQRTLRFLEQADTFFADWKHSESVRREEAALCAGPVPTSKSASEELLEKVKAVWAAGGFTEEQRKDLTDVRQLHRAFMRYAIKEPTAPDQDLESRFAEWLESTGKAFRWEKFESWTADQRQTHYLQIAGEGALALKKMVWAGDFGGAWQKLKDGIAKIDATPAEYADEICEAIIALAALIDIFWRMAVALGDIRGGLKKKISKDLQEKREEREKKVAERAKPDYKPKSIILGRLGAQAHDDKLAHEVLEDSPTWSSEGGDLAELLSLAWSIDGGIGVGVGGSAGGAGLGAFGLVGLSISPPSFNLPGDLLKTLSSKLMLVRFAAKFTRAKLEIIEYAIAHLDELPKDPVGLLRQGLLWYVQATHQVLVEVLTPGAEPVAPGTAAPDPKRGHQADPLEDWLFSFLSGTTITVNAKVEALAKAVGTLAAAEARAGLTGELCVSLASLLDPLIEALQKDAQRDPSDTAPLNVRTIPKITATVTQAASAGLALGPAQLDVGISGQALVADLVLPDGSPWRRAMEADLANLINQAVKSAKHRPAAMEARKQEGGFLHGMAALCDAIDNLLRTEIPAVQDWEAKRGDKKGYATTFVTNPAIQHMFNAIRDPAFSQKRQQKRKRVDELAELIAKNELHFATYPDTHGVGVKAVSAADSTFDTWVLLPDAEVGQFSPKDKLLLARSVYRIPLAPAPAHVAQDAFRKKSDPKGEPLQGLVVGFAKKSEAEAFASQRNSAWVESSVASIPPWASSRAGDSGTAQWYHWLNTKLFGAVEDLRGKGKRIEQPKLSVDAKGVVLDFGIVERGVLDQAPFASFGLVKESEELLTEAKVMEGVWEDDVGRLRAAVAGSIQRQGKPEPAPTAAAPAAAAPPPAPVAPPDTLQYRVKRAQAAVNHQLHNGGIPGWTKPLATDGQFGAKTGGALNAWAQSLGDPPVKGDPGAPVVEVGRKLAQALDGAHDEAVVAFAPPVIIPEDDAPWMAVARGEIGQAEIAGAVDNPRIREYHASTSLGAAADEVPWCSSFVNWTLTKAGIRGTHSAAAASWAGWGSESAARRGAITVIYNSAAKNSGLTSSGNHVGFLVEDVGWGWKLLGGNQGDVVKEQCYAKNKWQLKAMRWPA